MYKLLPSSRLVLERLLVANLDLEIQAMTPLFNSQKYEFYDMILYVFFKF